MVCAALAGQAAPRTAFPVGGNQVYRVWALHLDGAGRVCLAGHVEPQNAPAAATGGLEFIADPTQFGRYRDAFVSAYQRDGRLLWTDRFDGPGGNFDAITAVTADGEGNVYATGDSYGGAATGGDFVTLKYDAAGRRQWAARYTSSGARHDSPHAIAVDASGNIYVAGTVAAEGRRGGEPAGVKFAPDGRTLWAAGFDGPARGAGAALGIAADAEGGVLVVGATRGNSSDFTTVKLNRDGQQLWAARYDGPAHGADEANAVAVDRGGGACVAGSSANASNGVDCVTIKYGPDGRELWARRYNVRGRDRHSVAAAALSPAGDVYVTGTAELAGCHSSLALFAVTVCYSGDGRLRWSAAQALRDEALAPAAYLRVDAAGRAHTAWQTRRYDETLDTADVNTTLTTLGPTQAGACDGVAEAALETTIVAMGAHRRLEELRRRPRGGRYWAAPWTAMRWAGREGEPAKLRLGVVTSPGKPYDVQVSPDLATWSILARAASGTDGRLEFADPFPSTPGPRFYRVEFFDQPAR